MKKLLLFAMTVITNSIVAVSQPATVVWSEGFEGDPSLTWSASSGVWEMGIPTSGPNAAYGGTQCAATILAGNYPTTADTRLYRLAYFTVPSASENPRLRFWHWFSFSSSDYGKVQIHVQGTPSTEWIDVSGQYTYTGSLIWTFPSIDLSAYAGQTIQLAFYLHSSDSYVDSGWYIDDISFVTGPLTFNNPETWENGLGDWNPESGTWEVGIPTSGPGSAHGGSNCAATVLAGTYVTTTDSKLISQPFIVPSIVQNPFLRFQHWYSFSSSDYGKVLIKVEGNTLWEDLSQSYVNTGGGIWTYPALDLSTYAGKTVRIAFYFHSSDSYVSYGWYIDDIELVYNGVGIKDNSISEDNFLNIYPNPAIDRFCVEFKNPGHKNYDLTFYSIFGKTFMEIPCVSGERVELNKGEMAPGIYLIRLKGDKILYGKILIE